MDPLGLDIWMLVVAAFSLACFTLFALARFSPYEWRNPRPWRPRPDYLVNQFSLANSFWFITGTLLRQGSGVNPKVVHFHTRIPVFSSYLFLSKCVFDCFVFYLMFTKLSITVTAKYGLACQTLQRLRSLDHQLVPHAVRSRVSVRSSIFHFH